MSQWLRRITFGLVMLTLPCAPAWARDRLEIVTASFFGTAEDGDLQDATVAPDGTIYVAGNSGAPGKNLPGGIAVKCFGTAVKDAKCGHGFVAQLSPDGRKILRYVEFAPGVVIATTVRVNERAVYVGGYASAGLADLLKDKTGLIRDYPLQPEMNALEEAKAAGVEDKIANRPGLGRYGAPCVLRLSRDLQSLENGTYLEGWQQVWDKVRVYRAGKENVGNFHEFSWQPTHLEILQNGDLVVCHDGGYFRLPTAKDKELAKDDAKQLERYTFYDVPDYLSRLSPDLSQRAWKQSIYTPAVNPEVAKEVKNGWPLPHYSNPRTHRMRIDKDDNVYLCGWSASATSKEPWWSPYLWKVETTKGAPVWKAYNYDPLSGGGNRLGGMVSDTAVVTLALEEDGNILSSLIADGGNTVMGWSPKGDGSKFGAPIKGQQFGVKLVHFWNQVHRVDGKTLEGLGGARHGPWAWASDLASLPGKSVLAVGRYNGKFGWTDDAWWKDSSIENPNAFLRLYSPDFDLQFSTALPGVVPFALNRIRATRYILVGRAEQGIAPVKDALIAKSPGKSDGYFLILDWKPEK
jgi:hypothetical protein